MGCFADKPHHKAPTNPQTAAIAKSQPRHDHFKNLFS